MTFREGRFKATSQVGHHDFGGRNPIEIHGIISGEIVFFCVQIVGFQMEKRCGGKELFVRMGRDFGAAAGEGELCNCGSGETFWL